MKKPLKELETRVKRTYHGGKLIDEFLGKKGSEDSDMPEDWISSFIEKYFISALCDEIILKNCKVVVCYPPQISQ